MKKILSSRNSKGFTLIELMIVIVIIGILASIAIPAWVEYREQKDPEYKYRNSEEQKITDREENKEIADEIKYFRDKAGNCLGRYVSQNSYGAVQSIFPADCAKVEKLIP